MQYCGRGTTSQEILSRPVRRRSSLKKNPEVLSPAVSCGYRLDACQTPSSKRSAMPRCVLPNCHALTSAMQRRSLSSVRICTLDRLLFDGLQESSGLRLWCKQTVRVGTLALLGPARKDRDCSPRETRRRNKSCCRPSACGGYQTCFVGTGSCNRG
ncbi:hypothetical protein BD311DRAFT_439977 [Dichomitus squalens]|uniref:Uncharacterized protein n=1 Tax=Dichomitus squalens TaxID=114155 RepID=A0A4Q9N0B6_9APHY|nr:hypothetical protein BD311DRAFT_439977 [Dichomitus squalens]